MNLSGLSDIVNRINRVAYTYARKGKDKAMTVFVDGGINWTWYVDATCDDVTMTCTINRYWRLHNVRDQPHPQTFMRAKPLEDDARMVWALDVWDKANVQHRYRVLNPQHVFSYEPNEG